MLLSPKRISFFFFTQFKMFRRPIIPSHVRCAYNTGLYLTIRIVLRCIQNNCNIVPAVYYIMRVTNYEMVSRRHGDDGDHDDCHDKYSARLLYNIILLFGFAVEKTTTVVDSSHRKVYLKYMYRASYSYRIQLLYTLRFSTFRIIFFIVWYSRHI